MHPPENFKRVLDGKRYDVAKDTLIASNEYWDGSNFERGGTNMFLYVTPNGAYFTVYLTQWEGDRDRIDPVDVGEAIYLYEHALPEHEVEYEEAFPNVKVEDA